MKPTSFTTAFYLLTAGGTVALFLNNVLELVGLEIAGGLYMLGLLAVYVALSGFVAAGGVYKIVEFFKKLLG